MPRRAPQGRAVAVAVLVGALLLLPAAVEVGGLGRSVASAAPGARSHGGGAVPMLLTVTSFKFVPPQVDLGMAVSGVVVVHGATGWVRFNYSGLPPGCPSLNASAFTCTPTTIGGYLVTVVATAAGGASAQTSSVLTVAPPLAITGFTASPVDVVAGSNLEVHTAVSGGTPRFAFAYSGLPPGCLSVNRAWFNCTPSAGGSYSLGVTVTDGVGGSANATLTIAVAPAPSAAPVPFWSATTLLIVGGAVAAVAVVAAGWWLRRRRRTPRGPGGPAPVAPTGPAP